MTARTQVALALLALGLVCAGCHTGGSADPCTDVDCSLHGVCVAEGTVATCDCNHGFRAEGLECVAAETDGDADVDGDGDVDGDADGDADGDVDGDGDSDGDADEPMDGDADGWDPHGEGTVDPLEFCDELVALLCRGHTACCSDPRWASERECVAATLLDCRTTIGAVVGAPSNGFDGDRARTLLDEGWSYVEGPGACDTVLAEWLVERERLLSVSRGTLTEEEVCVGSLAEAFVLENYFQCEFALTCRIVRNLPFQAVCSPRSDVGEPCRGHVNCLTAGYCDGFTTVMNGTCLERKPEGSSCSSFEECESYVCLTDRCAPRTQENLFCEQLFNTY